MLVIANDWANSNASHWLYILQCCITTNTNFPLWFLAPTPVIYIYCPETPLIWPWKAKRIYGNLCKIKCSHCVLDLGVAMTFLVNLTGPPWLEPFDHDIRWPFPSDWLKHPKLRLDSPIMNWTSLSRMRSWRTVPTCTYNYRLCLSISTHNVCTKIRFKISTNPVLRVYFREFRRLVVKFRWRETLVSMATWNRIIITRRQRTIWSLPSK